MVTLKSRSLFKRYGSHINPWTLLALFIAAVFLGPVASIFYTASGDSEGLWPHLFETVLPRYVLNSLVLMAGVGLVSLIFGVSSAWVIVRYKFRGRTVFEWLLLLPAAVPAYLIAYTYTDFLEYAGPIQGVLRSLFGWETSSDYWFPEIRSMPGAMIVMGSVLYPYVYVLARAAFLMTPVSLYEAGMLAHRRSLFWRVALPLARPAIVAGLALVLMETVSDFGTVEYFAIETLTLGIFNVWLGMNSLTAAAQIASFAFLFIIALLAIELIARSRRRFADSRGSSKTLSLLEIGGGRQVICWLICFVPTLVGFLIPVGVLMSFIVKGESIAFDSDVTAAILNSIFLAGIVALLVMLSALFLSSVVAYQQNSFVKRITVFASLGYAFPGTILAIGVVTAGGAIDSQIADFLFTILGISYEGWLTSGIGLIIAACVIRFQAVGYGAITSGLERMPANMTSASRVLGHGFCYTVWKVIFPLIRMSFLAGGLLVFVDVMKELPMTLLLRPFNYETLPTHVYQYAKDELLEEAAFPALFIILVSVIPILIMNLALNRITRR